MECKTSVFVKWLLLVFCVGLFVTAGRRISFQKDFTTYHYFTYYRTLSTFYIHTEEASAMMNYPTTDFILFHGFSMIVEYPHD